MDEESLAGCTLDALSATIEQLAAAQTALLVGLFDVLVEYDRREGWRVDGMGSMVDWLAARLGLRRSTAAAWMETAARLASLPELRAVAAAGQVSWDQLQPLARLAAPSSDRMWANDGPALKPSQLASMARRHRPLTADDDRTAHEQRSLRTYRRRDGMLGLSGRLTADAGEIVQNAIRRLATRSGEAGPDGHDSWEHRCADALLELASTRVAADTDADAAAVVVHARAEVLAGEAGNAMLDSGTAISADTLRRLACDCKMRWVLYDNNGAVSVTEAKATIPRWLRRLVKGRDLTCRFPACERHGWGHIHHVVWRSRGGQTRIDSLAFLCWEHHRAVHEGGWTVTGDADGELTFTSPSGRSYSSRPAGLNPQTAEQLFGPEWIPDNRPDHPPDRN